MHVSGHLHGSHEWKNDREPPVSNQYDNVNDRWFEDRLVHRASCRVLLGKHQNAMPWLELSLNKFAVTKSAKNHDLTGNSILIVDKDSVSVLKSYASGRSTLYDRLIEHNVKLVPVQQVMKFLVSKYGQNPIPELVSNLKKVPLPQKKLEANAHYFFQENLIKLLCADFTFSLDKRFSQVAVVDADSLMPLHPERSAKITRPGGAPMSLWVTLFGKLTNGCSYRLPRTLADVDFVQKIINAPKSSGTVRKSNYIVLQHDMFNEFSSRDTASDLTLRVLQVARALSGASWAPGDEARVRFIGIDKLPGGDVNRTAPPLPVGESLPELLQNSRNSLDELCYWHCLPYEQPGSSNCVFRAKCVDEMKTLYTDLKVAFTQTLYRMRLKSLLTSISHLPEKSSFLHCCDDAQRTDSGICWNSRPYHQCEQALKKNSSLAMLDFSEAMSDWFYSNDHGLLFPKTSFENLLSHFNAPMEDWNFMASENNYMVDYFFEVKRTPHVFFSYGTEGADRFIRNASAFVESNPSGKLHCPSVAQRADIWRRDFEVGCHVGLIAGVIDECYVHLAPPHSKVASLCFRTGRGYFLGGGTGVVIGLAEHLYNQHVYPLLPEGPVRTCIDTVVSNGLVVTTVIAGGFFNVVGSMVGYTLLRTIMRFNTTLYPRNAGQGEPDHAHNE